MMGLIDACFIIDWADYSNREILKSICESVYITENVFQEVKYKNAIDLLEDWIENNYCSIVTVDTITSKEAKALIDLCQKVPEIPKKVDLLQRN